MEIQERKGEDRFLLKDQYLRLEENLREYKSDIPIVIVYAFDKRTRVGPFLFIDKTMIPAGARAIASSLYSAGFTNLRIVFQQWNPNFKPSKAKLNGRIPEILLISSMQIHSKEMYSLVEDAYKSKERPLIIAGGPKIVYQPEHAFLKNKPCADVAITGEEYILLQLMELLMKRRAGSEHIRNTFERLKNSQELNNIMGILYKTEINSREVLINTGTQKLLKELAELPNPLIGLSLVEPKHKRETLSKNPVPLKKIGKYAAVVSLITSHGCVEKCDFCPIPSYNQRTIRVKSADRMVKEMIDIIQETGITNFFGTDDSAFVNRVWLDEVMPAMANAEITKGQYKGKKVGEIISYGTEATLRSVILNKDKLPLASKAGFRFIWFGIEDLNAELVNKGQTAEKTKEIFIELRKNNISPMPMMIHYDEQPWTRSDGKYGLKETVEFLRDECRATSMQITYITPSIGSTLYEKHFNNKEVFKKVGGIEVDDYLFDGNHVIATKTNRAYQKQAELFRAYALFYNPATLLKSMFRLNKTKSEFYDSMFQILGNFGLIKSYLSSRNWLKSLKTGNIERHDKLPSASDYEVIHLSDLRIHTELKSKIEEMINLPLKEQPETEKWIAQLKEKLNSLMPTIMGLEAKSAALKELKEKILKKISEIRQAFSDFADANRAVFNQKVKELIDDLSLICQIILKDYTKFTGYSKFFI